MPYFLNIIWSFDPILFSIFGFQITWLAFLSVIGFGFGYLFLYYSYRREKKSTKELELLTVYLLIFGFLGARIGYFINQSPINFFSDLQETVNFSVGGFSSQGGILGILFGLIVYSFGKRNFWQIVDKVAVSGLIVAFFVNIGNFLSSNDFGSPTKSNLGIAFTEQTGSLLHEVLDKVSTSKVLADTIQKEETEFIPIKIEISFIEEFNNRNEIETYLNTEVKQFLANQPNLYEPQQSNLKYQIADQKKDNKITAELSTFIIKNHPTQLYAALFYLILFILFFNRYFKLSVGKTTSFLFILIFLYNSLSIYYFGSLENTSFISSLINHAQWINISFILIGIILFIKSLNQPSRVSYY